MRQRKKLILGSLIHRGGKSMRTLWWVLGGFVVYEFIAWRVNDQRAAAAMKSGGSYSELPFDLIGKYYGLPTAGLGPVVPGIPVPAGVAAGLSSPSAARAAAFNATNYPGLAPMPTVPQFSITDPLGLGGNPMIVN